MNFNICHIHTKSVDKGFFLLEGGTFPKLVASPHTHTHKGFFLLEGGTFPKLVASPHTHTHTHTQ